MRASEGGRGNDGGEEKCSPLVLRVLLFARRSGFYGADRNFEGFASRRGFEGRGGAVV